MQFSPQGIIALFILSIVQLTLMGQSAFQHITTFNFENYGAEDGLQSITPTKIIQDSRGFLWVCSFDGLYKYDGYNFTQFRHSYSNPNSISRNHVRTAMEDSKGRLWLSIWEYGINILNTTTDSILRLDSQHDSSLPPASLIHAFEEDPDHNIWICSQEGLFIIEEDSKGGFTEIDPRRIMPQLPDQFCTGEVKSILFDSKDRLWIGHEQGILMFNWKDKTLHYPGSNPGFPPATVEQINADQHGNIWMSTQTYKETRLWQFEEHNQAFMAFDTFPYKTNTRWIHFCFDKENRLWVSEFGNRMYVMDSHSGEVLLDLNKDTRPGYTVAESFLRSPFCDASGNVWFGGQGLYKVPYSKGFHSYQHPFAFKQFLRAIYSDSQYIWLGVFEDGLVRLNKLNNTVENFRLLPERSPYQESVFDIQPLDQDRLLVSGFGLIWLIDRHNGSVLRTYTLSNSPARDIFKDSNGNFWVASFAGLYRFDIDDGATLEVDVDVVKLVIEDPRGNLWLGGRYLTRYNPATSELQYFHKIKVGSDSLAISFINDMVVAADTLWIGTGEGLIAYDMNGKSGYIYHEDHGLRNTHIFSIINDHSGQIWVATSWGIARLDKEKGVFRNYSRMDGLANAVYTYRSKFIDENGTLYFGGEGGLDFFHPDELRPALFHSQLALTDHMFLDEHSSFDVINQSFSLSPQNVLTEIAVSALHFSAEESVEYYYTLKDFYNSWVSLGHDRTIRLPHLPYGSYTLEVKARSADSVWTTSPLSIPINVMPAFYETTAFRLGLAGIIVLAGFAIIRYIGIRRKEKAYQKTVQYFAHSHYGENSVDEILWDVARNVISRLDFEDCVVYLLDRETSILHQKAAYGPKNPRGVEISDPIEIPLGEGIVGHVAQSGKGEIVYDTRSDPRYIIDDEVRASEIAVPILYEGKTIGVIDAESEKKGFFTQRHLEILTEIAAYCSEKIVKAQVQKEAREKARELKEIQAEMAQLEKRALLAQMNPHFIFNAMNSIQHFITENDQESALRYLNKFSRLIREVLNIASEERITLARELQFLTDYVSLEQLRFRDRFTFELDIDKDIEPMVTEIPAFILQPHVENAILHGFSNGFAGGKLVLRVKKVNHDDIGIEITDNGIGRKKAGELRIGDRQREHASKGLSIIRERFILLSQQNPAYSMDIDDLVTPEGQPAGTRVFITIPSES